MPAGAREERPERPRAEVFGPCTPVPRRATIEAMHSAWRRGLAFPATVTLAALLVACSARGPDATPTHLGPSASPSTAPASRADPLRAVVYLARDRLPPIAWPVAGAGAGAAAVDRVRSRVEALVATRAPEGRDPAVFNVVPLTAARLATVSVAGDLASLDFTVPNDDWSLGGSAMLKAFLQQLVYTASEEPGVRRVLLTQNGGQMAVIGGEGLMVDHPVSRESVAGYAFEPPREPVRSYGEVVPAQAAFGVEAEQAVPALARAKVELRRAAGSGPWLPEFVTSVSANDESAFPERGKWLATVDVPGVDGVPNVGSSVGTGYRPLRWVAAARTDAGMRYTIGLDELRPWRAVAASDPVAILVDFGGDPDAVNEGMAVYAPRWGATVGRRFTVSGVARTFEAAVSWRARDVQGAIVASGFTHATVGTSAAFGAYEIDVALPDGVRDALDFEVYETSMRDGSDRNLVRLPLRLR